MQLRGFRVELGEIEAVASAVAGVQSAAVVLQDGDSQNAALIAYVAPESAEQEAVLAACSAKLPRYMVPSAVVRLAQLPRLPNSKVTSSCLLLFGRNCHVLLLGLPDEQVGHFYLCRWTAAACHGMPSRPLLSLLRQPMLWK